MNFKEFLSLKEYNTFHIDVKSVYSFFCSSEDQIIKLSESAVFKENKKFILGGGSNVLFSKDFEGLVIVMQNKGIQVIEENDDEVFIKVSSGEVWDDFVNFAVENNFGGIENLSLIPGTVGASPIQNIGAYGREVKDVIFEVQTMEIGSSKMKTFTNDECKFGYRDSVFKKELKDKYIILNVTFKLTKVHKLYLEYGNISDRLKGIEQPSIKDVRNVVVQIREEKLPNVELSPNAGSFFKNPVIDEELYLSLKDKFPNLVSYPAGKGKMKLAAGQLIDLCGWKGKKEEGVCVHEKQALVIVNYGNADGNQILSFSEKVRESVYEKFGVRIEREVTLV